MPSNPLTQEEVNSYAINRALNPEGYTGLSPYMPGGYFLSTPPGVNGPALWRLFDASFISSGIIDRNRLGTGSTGAGNLYLADDGTWKTVSGGGGGTWGSITGTLSSQTDLQTALDAKQNTISVDANEGLELTGASLGTKYNSTIADGVNSVAVGGATVQPASSWKSKTLVQVLDTILFPTILASITTVKSASLAVSGTSGTVEIGTSVSRTLTATFVRGTITNGDGTVNANPLVGAASNYAFSGTGISLTNQAGNTLAINVAVVSGLNNWAVTVTHAIGTGAYFDNKGNAGTNLDASRVSGTIIVSSSTPTVTGKYRQFFGPTTTTPTTSAEVRAFGSNFTDTNSFNSGTFTQTKFVIAIPATRNLVSVITSSLENITSNFVLATFNVNDAGGTAVSYKVYTFTSVTPLGLTATITLS